MLAVIFRKSFHAKPSKNCMPFYQKSDKVESETNEMKEDTK